MSSSSSSSQAATTPEIRIDKPSNLCSYGHRRLVMTGFLRVLLTNHFSQARSIEHPALRERLWKDDETTGILIEAITRWTPEVAQRRPAVIIKPGRLLRRRKGINNLEIGSGLGNGNPHFQQLKLGSHTLFCIAGEGAEAETLADEVDREMQHFASVIRRGLDLVRFEVTDMGEIFELEEATENYVVPVTVGYAWWDRWELRPHVPVLRRVSAEVNIEGTDFQINL